MPRKLIPGRFDPIVHHREFRLLACNFKVRSNCEILARQVNFIAQDARQNYPLVHEQTYEVRSQDGHYQIIEDLELAFTASDLNSLTQNLLWRIHGKAFENIADYVCIHAGCAEHKGNRFLIVGDSGAGKTTLMTRLLFEGFQVHGDELVTLRDGGSMPFPRRFHIKESSLELLPQLREFIDDAPYITELNEQKIYAFSPSEAGFEWEIRNREVSVFFYLEGNHGGETRVEDCPKYLMVQKVMPRTFFSISHEHLKIGELCRAVDRAACFIIYLGDIGSAVGKIRNIMNKP